MTLILLSYNNYFNRIIKRDVLSDYLTYRNKYVDYKPFQVRDGVNTTLEGLQWTESWTPDYCLVLDDNNNIASRWFVKDTNRLNANQISASLQRDVVADFYEDIINAPCYIEKGFVTDDDPLIFNKEPFSCNQIKTSERLLADYSFCSWLVLYFSQAAIADNKLANTISSNVESYIDLDVPTINDWTMLTRYGINGYKSPFIKSASVYIDAKGTTDECLTMIDVNSNNDLRVTYKAMNNDISNQSELEYTGASGVTAAGEASANCIYSNGNNIKSQINALGVEQDSLESLMNFNGKLVKTNDNKYYRITITETGYGQDYSNLTSGGLYDALSAAFKVGGIFKSGWTGSFTKAFYSNVQYKRYDIQYNEETNGVVNYQYDFSKTADGNAVTLLDDQPFGIIALPYTTVFGGRPGFDNAGFTPVPAGLNLLIARDLCSQGFGADKYILDAQILPYCPCPNLNGIAIGNGDVQLNLTSYLEQNEYVYGVTDGNSQLCGFALMPRKSKFTNNIFLDIPQPDNLKLANQCDMYRLVSPNYNGQFEFSVAKNRGLDYVNIDCTYKPYQPYIHVNPNFNGLYGQDFDDARGLICGGDFSMTVVTSAWENYKLQNKNYQEIFNRQIQNLDKTNELALEEQAWSTAAGAAQGGAAGAVVGAQVGGAVGAGIGAAAGAGISLAAGLKDRAIMKERMAEQRDYTVDMHTYQLGNIKALPNSLAKVDAYNNNNKIFPFLEYYTCTDKEKYAFERMMQYQGESVGVIDLVKNYLIYGDYTFFKGSIMFLFAQDETWTTALDPEQISKEDSHVAYAIYDEIQKGLYIRYENLVEPDEEPEPEPEPEPEEPIE